MILTVCTLEQLKGRKTQSIWSRSLSSIFLSAFPSETGFIKLHKPSSDGPRMLCSGHDAGHSIRQMNEPSSFSPH